MRIVKMRSSATPGASTLATSLAAPSGASANATGFITSDTVGNWIGSFSVGTDLQTSLAMSGTTISSAVVNSGTGTATIITLSVAGNTFSPSGTLSSTQYSALVAAGSNLRVQFTDSLNVVRFSALTRS